MKGFRALLSIVVLSASTMIFAKDFTNQYCQFTLPDGWNCQLEGSEWVCQSENADRKKEAIIILAAKIAGSKDRLEDYQAYLKAPKTFTLPGGKTQVSEAKYVKSAPIAGQNWVDALHLASEVPGFYTRYLATVKEDLGIAVTFSVAKDFYSNYQDVFDKVVATLKVFRQKAGGTEFKQKVEGGVAGEGVIDDTQNQMNIDANQGQKKGGGLADSGYLLYIIAGAVVIFILMKLKKKKKK